MAKKILIIEDEPALQKTLSNKLDQEGYKTISSLNGEDGLKMTRKEMPDLILLDLILPKKNGFEVLKELRADNKLKNIPVIVLTNLEDVGDIQKVITLGATTYLVKADYGLNEIITKVKKTLKDED